MQRIDELSVDEISSSTEETCRSLDICVSRIVNTIKVALGIITIGDIFPNLSNTIEIVCQCSYSINSFSKLKLSNDGKSLIGIMFIGKSALNENNCFYAKTKTYKSILNYKLFSIQITDKTQKQIISLEFDRWFKKFTNSINGQYDMYNKKRNNNIELNCCFPKKSDDWEVSNSETLYKSSASDNIRNVSTKKDTLVATPCSITSSEYKKDSEIVIHTHLNTQHDINEKLNNDVLYYHPHKIEEMKNLSSKKNLLEGRSYLQSPLSLTEKSELIENKTATIKEKKNKLTKEQKKILKKSNCKSYTLKVSKKLNLNINNSNLHVITEI